MRIEKINENDTVEVICKIRVRKNVLTLLVEEDYLGLSEDEFFDNCIKAYVSCLLSELDWQEMCRLLRIYAIDTHELYTRSINPDGHIPLFSASTPTLNK